MTAGERCPMCGEAGWIIDCNTIDKAVVTLEVMPCFYPECGVSGRPVATLSFKPPWESVALHPASGQVMSVTRNAPTGLRSDCVFCDIVAGSVPATVVREWRTCVAIVPLNPVVTGHVLVFPRRHVTDALEDASSAAVAMLCAAELARPPCNIITSVGREATQSVFHLHLHIVPRREGDGLALPWSE